MDEEAVLKTVGRETDLGVRFSLPPQKYFNINILNKKIMFKRISNPTLNGFSKGNKNEFTNTKNEQKQWEIFRKNYWIPSA